jgi:membrane dipeptidase
MWNRATTKFLIDGHLDLAWNALAFDRDQTKTIAELRERENQMPHASRGRCTVSLPEMRKGNVIIAVATLLARAKPQLKPSKEYIRTDIDSLTQDFAWAITQGQLAYYQLLESRGEIAIIKDIADLRGVWAKWVLGPKQSNAVGVMLHLEGCDPIIDIPQVGQWHRQGLRSASLAHYGPSVYGYGSGEDGPLTDRGRDLLTEFNRFGIAVDLTHTADTAFWQTLDHFHGRVFASHCNTRALAPAQRQLSDDMIKAIIDRKGIIGCVPHAWMLVPGWKTGVTDRATVTLQTMANHIQHICNIAGNARHVAIGSDLDGGFGTEECANDLETIADLQKLENILKGRGMPDADIDAIFHGNWLRFLGEILPG